MKSIVLFAIALIALITLSSCEYNPVEPYDLTPKVSIVRPINNSSVSDSITVQILVNNIDAKRVELFFDHYVIDNAVFQKPPYEYFIDCRWYEEGSQHILQAKAYNQSGKVIESDYTIFNIYRFMPSSLNALLTSDTTISLSWSDNCKFETGFELEQAIDDSNFIKIALLDSNVTTYTIHGNFETEKKYFFRVRALTENQFSGYSNITQASIQLFTPVNLRASSITDTSIVLNWDDNNTFEKGYAISEFSNGTYNVIRILPAGTNSFIYYKQFYIYNQYKFAIHAIRDNYFSDKGYFQPVLISFLPPTELTFEHNSQSSVKLKWNYNTTFEKGFIIYRTDDQNVFSEIGRVGKNFIEYVSSNLDTSKSYLYKVSAYTDGNTSGSTNVIKVFFGKTISLNKKIQVPYGISEAVVSNDFSIAAFGGYISNGVCIRIIKVSDGSIIRTFLGDSTDQIFERLTISPDNRFVAGIGNYHTLLVFDISTGLLVKKLDLITSPNYIKYSSDGKFLIMERNNKLRFYNTTTWSWEDRMIFNDDSYCLTIDNIDQYVAAGFYNSDAKIYNYQTGAYVHDISESFRTFALKYNLNNKKLFFSAYGSLKILDINSNTITRQLDNIGAVNNFDVTDDEDLVVFTGGDGISFWNTQKNKHYRVPFDNDTFREVYISPDNNTLFAREFFKSYVLCDLEYKWLLDTN
ncbi:MAG: hypothetical protein IPJ23_17040 [Ignavibacteriales bacterium]|nr:hypothetical protein [Ignavibacteriales bacterium]